MNFFQKILNLIFGKEDQNNVPGLEQYLSKASDLAELEHLQKNWERESRRNFGF